MEVSLHTGACPGSKSGQHSGAERWRNLVHPGKCPRPINRHCQLSGFEHLRVAHSESLHRSASRVDSLHQHKVGDFLNGFGSSRLVKRQQTCGRVDPVAIVGMDERVNRQRPVWPIGAIAFNIVRVKTTVGRSIAIDIFCQRRRYFNEAIPRP
jgi:hypothetical protein